MGGEKSGIRSFWTNLDMHVFATPWTISRVRCLLAVSICPRVYVATLVMNTKEFAFLGHYHFPLIYKIFSGSLIDMFRLFGGSNYHT